MRKVGITARIAGATGLLMGLLSALSGMAVLLGIKTPDYLVLTWLVVYNVSVGLVSIGAGMGIWRGRAWGAYLAAWIAVGNGAVLLALLLMVGLGTAVAVQSLGAMTFRTVLWSGIAGVSKA